MIKTICLLIVSTFMLTNAQLNRCPSSPINLNFDPSRYVGKWYEIEKYSAGFEDNLKCVFAEYSAFNESFIQVQNSGYNVLTNVYDRISGYAYAPNFNTPNHLVVVLRIPIAPGFFIENTGKYDVWATDYENYSLVYSCQNNPQSNAKVENVFILSRSKTIDPTVLNNLKSMLASNGFNLSLLEVTAQDC